MVRNVTREFRVFRREKGFASSIKSILKRNYEVKKAVNNISFHIREGELEGYIGSNGAGKSTTIKMLAGILVPTSGTVLVNGKEPHRNRKENAMNMGSFSVRGLNYIGIYPWKKHSNYLRKYIKSTRKCSEIMLIFM